MVADQWVDGVFCAKSVATNNHRVVLTFGGFNGIFVVTMFVDSSTTRLNGKAYPRHLLRESYREAGKVKHRTIANLSHCKAEEVEAIRLALRHKADLAGMVAAAAERALELVQGPSVGAVWLLSQLARDLGIVAALGSDRQGKLALWQVIARVLDQGSRLSAVRLAGGHAAGAALGMISFDEDDLYANLDWLAQHQADIETRLFAQRKPASAPDVFLYDVTSTYLEGEQNAFAAFGYNRDRKSGQTPDRDRPLVRRRRAPAVDRAVRRQPLGRQDVLLAAEPGGGAFRRRTGDFRRRLRHDQSAATRRTGRRRFPLHHRH